MLKIMLNRISTEECMTKEEFLYELQKETLSNQRHYLCNHLQPEKLLPFLQSKNCLSVEDCEQIRSLSTTHGKVNRLTDIIIKSGPGCLTKLIKAIKKCNKTQLFIAEKLECRYEYLMNKDSNRVKLEQITNGHFHRQTPPPPYTSITHPSIPPRSAYVPSQLPSDPDPMKVRLPSLSFSIGPRTPVEWPSTRDRSETTATCATNIYRDNVSIFHSNDYKQTEPEGRIFIDDQREEISKLTLENSRQQDLNRESISYRPNSYQDLDDDELLTESEMVEHCKHMNQLRRRSRHPDEHDSALISTEVKRPIIPDDSNLAKRGFESSPPDVGGTSGPDYVINRYRIPDDESFEVSGEDSNVDFSSLTK